jgi:hypothetical protein
MRVLHSLFTKQHPHDLLQRLSPEPQLAIAAGLLLHGHRYSDGLVADLSYILLLAK